jgi:hypothetical protein
VDSISGGVVTCKQIAIAQLKPSTLITASDAVKAKLDDLATTNLVGTNGGATDKNSLIRALRTLVQNGLGSSTTVEYQTNSTTTVQAMNGTDAGTLSCVVVITTPDKQSIIVTYNNSVTNETAND